MKPVIELSHVSKSYDGETVVDDVSLRVSSGELFVLVGESGSGKTTILKMINRLIEPEDGRVFFKGEDVKAQDVHDLRLQIGYVLQQIALFPTMSVAENVEVIPEMKGMAKKALEKNTQSLLNAVGLDPKHYARRLPRELSGGEQQRVGIVRALAGRPPVVLMDEPFSALDPLSRSQLQDLVLQLHVKFGMTILFVTHDIAEALKLGDRIGVLKKGKLEQVDTPEEILAHPENAFVADFFAGAKRVWLDSPLRELIAFGEAQAGEPAHAVNNIDVFAGSTPLRAALPALAKGQPITVLSESGWAILSSDQVWAFLASCAGTDESSS